MLPEPMDENCGVCRRIAQIKDGKHQRFVAETPSGYVVLLDNQSHRGITLLLSKVCARELYELTPDQRASFLEDMARVAHAVQRTFGAAKMNYELLGNSEPHLHWWLVPRYADEPNPTFPIWNNPDFMRAYEGAEGDDAEAVADSLRSLQATLSEFGAGWVP
jgi:diadenosine tetraphosphate (Ap4A) HIT family hydrolase